MSLSRWSAFAGVFVVAAGLALGLPTPARAQGNVGVIDGRVHDQSRAAIPGATVTGTPAARSRSPVSWRERRWGDSPVAGSPKPPR